MKLKVGLFLTSGLAICAAMPAHAAETPEGATRGAAALVEELVVTAQRREERLRDVPVAVTAFTAEQRDLLSIDSAQDIARLTPGMAYTEHPDRVTLRGIGRATNSLGSEPGVALYYDGAYDSEGTPLANPPLLIDRIEVLRGPQGTLYGRNSIGGAVNLVSRRPTKAFEGAFEQSYGSHESSRSTAYVSGPLTDKLGFRLAGDHWRQPAYIAHTGGCNHCEDGAEPRTYLEAQLEAQPSDDIGLWLRYGYLWKAGASVPTVRRSPYDTTTRSIGLTINPTLNYTTPNPGVAHAFTVDQTPERRSRIEHRVVVQFDWNLKWAELKYLGSYLSQVGRFSGDFDESTRVGFTDPVSGSFVSSELGIRVNGNKELYSNELLLRSPQDGRALQWIVGLYQSREISNQPLAITAPKQPEIVNNTVALGDLFNGPPFTALPNPDGNLYYQKGHLVAKTKAVFGQIDWQFAPTFSLTLGGRYTWDKKHGTEQQRIVVFAPDLAPGFGVEASNKSQPFSEDWSGATARVALQWKPNDTSMLYASYGRGYKAGGYNLGTFTPAVKPENVDAFEVGYKALLAGQLDVGIAGFYNDYRNMQLVSTRCLGVGSDPCAVTQNAFTNVPKARTYGVEVEANWRVTEAFSLVLSYGYLNATYREFPNIQNPLDPSGAPLDLSGEQLPTSPKHKAALSAVYSTALGEGTLNLSGTLAWTDQQHFNLYDFAPFRVDDVTDVGFRVAWTNRTDRYTVSAYVKNALDKKQIDTVSLNDTGGGEHGRAVQYNVPRLIGGELQVRF